MISRRPSPGNDSIKGTELADRIDALAGNDTIFGLGGDDSLSGGEGNDSIRGGDGADLVIAGNDDTNNFNRLFGDNNNDLIIGSFGRDSLFGGDDQDRLFGNGNSDFLDGGDGNDRLFGGAGIDALVGNNGSDVLQGAEDFVSPGEFDELNGNEGFDTFVVGNSDDNFYQDGNRFSRGLSDHAFISDFTKGEDKIQLSKKYIYGFEEVSNLPGSSHSGVGIFMRAPGAVDELVVVVGNVEVSDLELQFDSGKGLAFVV